MDDDDPEEEEVVVVVGEMEELMFGMSGDGREQIEEIELPN